MLLGGNVECGMDHRHRRRQWNRERNRCVQRRRQPRFNVANRDADDCGTNVHGDSGRVVLHILDYADFIDAGVCDGDERHRHRYGECRVQLDRHRQRHMAHDHLWIKRNRRGFGELQRSGQHDDLVAHRYADDCRTDIHRHSAGSGLHLHAVTNESDAGSDWRRRHCERVDLQRLQLDRVERRHLGDDHERRERKRSGYSDLQRRSQHRDAFENSDPDDRRQAVQRH